jgi:hypothetical protein
MRNKADLFARYLAFDRVASSKWHCDEFYIPQHVSRVGLKKIGGGLTANYIRSCGYSILRMHV